MQGRVVYAPAAVDIARSAYLLYCVSIEAQGESLEELLADCRRRGVAYEGFHVQLLRPPPRLKLRSDEVVLQAANAVTGRPNLSHPRVALAVVAAPAAPGGGAARWTLGRIISHGENRWLQGKCRPVHFSSALPQRFSRALVNLVAAPGDTLIDPCCGIGTPLIEALQAGVVAFGADTNPKMLRGLAENLRHFGFPLRLFRADARRLVGHFEAAVLDFPYGRNLQLDASLCRDILEPLGRAVRRAALVSAQPLDEVLAATGLRVVRRLQVHKGYLVRHVYVVVAQQRGD